MSRTIDADHPQPYRRIITTAEVLSPALVDSAAVTTARVYMAPIQISVTLTIDRIAVIWGGTTAGNARIALYRDNGDTPVGGALVVQSASIAKAGTTRKQEFTIAATQLTPGLYWIAIQSDENTSKFERIDLAYEAGGTLTGYYYTLGGYGVFTNPCPASAATAAICPGGYVRVASIP